MSIVIMFIVSALVFVVLKPIIHMIAAVVIAAFLFLAGTLKLKRKPGPKSD